MSLSLRNLEADEEIALDEGRLSDMVMPGGTGSDLAGKLRNRYPAMKVILMSGYTDDALASREADRTVADAFLEKPFATQDLLRRIRELLGAEPAGSRAGGGNG